MGAPARSATSREVPLSAPGTAGSAGPRAAGRAAGSTAPKGARVLALALGGACLILVCWSSLGTAPLLKVPAGTAPSPPPSAATPTVPPTGTPLPQHTPVPAWLPGTVGLIALACAIAVLAGLVVLVSFARQRLGETLRWRQPARLSVRHGAPAAPPAPGDASRARAGSAGGDHGPDEGRQEPADAVVRAWASLEREVTAELGPGPAGETARALADRLATRRQVPGRELAELTTLYQRARFSPHRLTAADSSAALADLAQVRRGLAVPTQAGSTASARPVPAGPVRPCPTAYGGPGPHAAVAGRAGGDGAGASEPGAGRCGAHAPRAYPRTGGGAGA